MGLRDIGATLPPGFRFYPSDEELVCHYLYKKIANEQVLKGTLVDIDLHTCEPWQLPEVAKLNANEWYFFSFRDRKYATGYRTNRATASGYWKATGKDRIVLDPKTKEIVGMRKTLVFYKNRAPNGIKTGWIMHEFRLETPHMPPKEDWVLCRVFHKRKAENSSNYINDDFMFETTVNSVSFGDLPSPSPLPDGTSGYQQIITPLSSSSGSPHHHQHTDHEHDHDHQTSNSFLNLLQDSHQNKNNYPVDDEFGFLWEGMNMAQETSLEHGMCSSLEENMGFQIDNGMVFL